jgi:AraC-like DNA-binding protein
MVILTIYCLALEKTMKIRQHSVRSQLGARVDVLDELGLQMEYFPCYKNTSKNNNEINLAEVEVVLFSIFLSGEGTHYIGDQSFYEKGVSIGITYYGVGHNIVTSKEGMEIMNFYLDLNILKYPDLTPELQPYLKTFLPFLNEERNPLLQMVRIELSNPETIKRLTFNMYDEFMNKPQGYAESVQLYFKLFLMECCRQAQLNGIIPIKKTLQKKFEMMESLRLHLVENYQKPQSLEDLVKIFPVDKSYLCRLFKDYMGKSIFDYLLEVRLQKAMWLLKSTSDKILYIAMQSGFTDLAYFNRQFKKRQKISPSQYRQQMRLY